LKIPFYLRILSYFQDVLIKETRSEINPELKVYLSLGRLKLITGNAIYSYEDKYINFVEAFNFIHIKNKAVNRALILGFGLRIIPYILEK